MQVAAKVVLVVGRQQVGAWTVLHAGTTWRVRRSANPLVDVAVHDVAQDMAVVDIAAQRIAAAQFLVAAKVQHIALRAGVVRVRIALRRIAQHGQRKGLVAVHQVVGVHHRQIDVSALILKADLAKQLADAAGTADGPARFVVRAGSEVVVGVVAMPALLQVQRAPSKGTERGLDRRTRKREPALGVHRHGTTQGVQSVDRIRAGNQRDVGNRNLRDQVPGHDVTKRLVHAHAIEKHRQALWRTQHW